MKHENHETSRLFGVLASVLVVVLMIFSFTYPSPSESEGNTNSKISLVIDSELWASESDQAELNELLQGYGGEVEPKFFDFTGSANLEQVAQYDAILSSGSNLQLLNKKELAVTSWPFPPNRLVKKLGPGAWDPVLCTQASSVSSNFKIALRDSVNSFDEGRGSAVKVGTNESLRGTPCEDVARGQHFVALSYQFDGVAQTAKGSAVTLVHATNDAFPLAAVLRASNDQDVKEALKFVDWWSTDTNVLSHLSTKLDSGSLDR